MLEEDADNNNTYSSSNWAYYINKRAKMALDRSPDFSTLLKPFFFCRFQRRIYKNFFMSVQCKKPPFTNTMFIDRSKFQEQF